MKSNKQRNAKIKLGSGFGILYILGCLGIGFGVTTILTIVTGAFVLLLSGVLDIEL